MSENKSYFRGKAKGIIFTETQILLIFQYSWIKVCQKITRSEGGHVQSMDLNRILNMRKKP